MGVRKSAVWVAACAAWFVLYGCGDEPGGVEATTAGVGGDMVSLPATGTAGTTAAGAQPTAGSSAMIAPGGGTGGTAMNPAMGGSGGGAAGAGMGGAAGSAMAGSGGAMGGTGGMAGSEPMIEVPTERFSFFVTSLAALQDLSDNEEGFGGDLRFGETGPGAGLRGADKLCATIADRSMPNASAKGWRAFLSATAGEDGEQVNAVDRIGEGPWYDRLGRLFAPDKASLFHFRPTGDAAIINDFPNEDGVPNHDPDGTGEVDNHDTLTGSNAMGQLYNRTATCLDWTSAVGNAASGKPRVGHSWPRMRDGGGRPGGMMGGGDGDGYGHWMSSLDEAGCAPGVRLVEMGGPIASDPSVGSGGGYGGFYCFALKP
jgi:hypothetical protein